MRSLFRVIFSLIGLIIVGNFVLRKFPETVPYWEAAKAHASSFYSLLVSEFGMVGAVIVFAVIVYIFSRN